jgi:hypothetical protein
MTLKAPRGVRIRLAAMQGFRDLGSMDTFYCSTGVLILDFAEHQEGLPAPAWKNWKES